MLDWKQLLNLSNWDLAKLDIARVNLACAAGLPGSDQIDEAACLDKLDYWARCVKQYTDRVLPHFRRKRYDYNNSEPYFRVLTMITVLQRDLGLRYNPAKIPDDAPFDTADRFIHGALLGEGGTCASMPVVYAAVGSRLGYPISLVHTNHHLFARWDAPGVETFNIEAAGSGFSSFPDEYYRTGRYAMTAAWEAAYQHLQSLSPREELANFLDERACHWLHQKEFRLATESYICAGNAAPTNVGYALCLLETLRLWKEELTKDLPPNFPPLRFTMHFGWRRHLTIPEVVEREMIQCDVLEKIKSDPGYEVGILDPLRRAADLPISELPTEIRVAVHR